MALELLTTKTNQRHRISPRHAASGLLESSDLTGHQKGRHRLLELRATIETQDLFVRELLEHVTGQTCQRGDSGLPWAGRPTTGPPHALARCLAGGRRFLFRLEDQDFSAMQHVLVFFKRWELALRPSGIGPVNYL